MPRRYSTLFFLFFVVGFVALANKCHAAASPSIPSEPTPIRYELSYGPDPENLATTIDLGEATDYLLTGLDPGTYYCSVTAISPEGIRSSPSALVTHQVPQPDPITPPPDPPMVRLNVYQVDLLTRQRTIIATLYVPRKERDFFQLGIDP
jgi:hypothetical protein